MTFQARPPSSIIHILRDTLTRQWQPETLTLEDESARHAGHAAAPKGGESHFRLRIVSKHFEGLSRLERHRRIHATLANVLDRIHALSIQALTPDEAGKNPP